MVTSEPQGTVRFLSQISDLLPGVWAEQRAHLKATAKGFSLIELLGPGEVQISRLFANLFDPLGSHGQGGLFLNRLAEAVNLKPVEPKDEHLVRVALEARTSESRRIDILIHYSGHWRIGIENKPWAREQWNQLPDYQRALEAQVSRKGSQEAWRLVYFADRAPDHPEALDREMFRQFYFSSPDSENASLSLASIFDPALPDENELPNSVKTTLQDLCKYFGWKRREDRGMESKTNQEIIDAARSEPQKLEAFSQIWAAAPDLYQSEFSNLDALLKAQIQSQIPDVIFDGSLSCLARSGEPWSGVGLSRINWPKWISVYIEKHGDKPAGFFGICFKGRSFVEKHEDICRSLRILIGTLIQEGNWKSDDLWPAWKKLEFISSERPHDLSMASFFEEIIRTRGDVSGIHSRIAVLAEELVWLCQQVDLALAEASKSPETTALIQAANAEFDRSAVG